LKTRQLACRSTFDRNSEKGGFQTGTVLDIAHMAGQELEEIEPGIEARFKRTRSFRGHLFQLLSMGISSRCEEMQSH
jgi:hypothetical protein